MIIPRLTSPTLLKPEIKDHGLFISHNMSCAVCLEQPAVYSSVAGIFAPCWDCQRNGWRLQCVEKAPWWKFWKR